MGWGYNILPFIEQHSLHDLGKGQSAAAKRTAVAQRLGHRLTVFTCPTRRNGGPYANGWGITYRDSDTVTQVFRGDYAANSGHQDADEFFAGPASLAAGDSPTFPWPSTNGLSGLIFQRSEIANDDITRGRSEVYLLGEKYLNPDRYLDGNDAADNENVITGFNNDNFRSTFFPPLRDRRGYSDSFRFGSAHLNGAFMAYADGSVRLIMFTVDPAIHRNAGNRK